LFLVVIQSEAKDLAFAVARALPVVFVLCLSPSSRAKHPQSCAHSAQHQFQPQVEAPAFSLAVAVTVVLNSHPQPGERVPINPIAPAHPLAPYVE
jgi:hypothetical protein